MKFGPVPVDAAIGTVLVHSVLLPNGKVLTFGTPTGDAATQDGRYFDVWDPYLELVTPAPTTEGVPA
jgi:hypothetical protein